MNMKISTAIERAINTELWDGEKASDLYSGLGSKTEYSCIAIDFTKGVSPRQYDRIDEGLIQMGLNTSSCFQFHDIHGSERRQYARALWLTWAALMAAEQGL